jgi:alpha-D-xyloside xylohydrolase
MKKFILIAWALLTLSACNRNTVVVPCDNGAVRLQVISPEIVRVSVSPNGKFHDRKSLVVLPQQGCKDFKLLKEADKVVLSTSALTVEVTKADGTLQFFKADGTPLALDGRSSFEPLEVEGKKAWSTTVTYASTEDEAFYGLGQQQAGEFNHKGLREELYQYNTKISVPMVVSNKGYGLLFDAYSLSRWGSAQPYKQLGEVFDLELTGTYCPAQGEPLVQKEDSLFYENEWAIKNLPQMPLMGAKVTYEGSVTARETGDYHFIQYYAGFQSTQVDGKEVMSRRWRPAWNPNSYKFTVHLEAGKPTPVKIEWEPDGDVSYIGLRVAPTQS